MSTTGLADEIKKRHPFESPAEEALLNLSRTTSCLAADFEKLFKSHGISDAKYNVLRILRGVGGEGLPCLEVANRMITRVPDITRLVDRLEAAHLVTRTRIDSDRRVVLVRITEAGRKLLSKLDEPIAALHQQQLSHMTDEELVELNRLLVKARKPPGC